VAAVCCCVNSLCLHARARLRLGSFVVHKRSWLGGREQGVRILCPGFAGLAGEVVNDYHFEFGGLDFCLMSIVFWGLGLGVGCGDRRAMAQLAHELPK
jgi:hypothetical protein